MSGAVSLLVEQVSARVTSIFDARLMVQVFAGATLGLIEGLSDADRGRPPYLGFRQQGSGPAGLRALLSKGGAAAKVLVLGLTLDAADQFATTGRVDVGEAVVIALMLAVAPYALLRSLVMGWATHHPHRR